MTLELAQIDGGGEGVLPALWRLAERSAQIYDLQYVERMERLPSARIQRNPADHRRQRR